METLFVTDATIDSFWVQLPLYLLLDIIYLVPIFLFCRLFCFGILSPYYRDARLLDNTRDNLFALDDAGRCALLPAKWFTGPLCILPVLRVCTL